MNIKSSKITIGKPDSIMVNLKSSLEEIKKINNEGGHLPYWNINCQNINRIQELELLRDIVEELITYNMRVNNLYVGDK